MKSYDYGTSYRVKDLTNYKICSYSFLRDKNLAQYARIDSINDRQDVPRSNPINPPILANIPSPSTIRNLSMISTSGAVKMKVC